MIETVLAIFAHIDECALSPDLQQQLQQLITAPTPPGNSTNALRIKLPLPSITSAIGRIIRGTGFRISIPATWLPTIVEQDEFVDGGFAENEKEAINDEDLYFLRPPYLP